MLRISCKSGFALALAACLGGALSAQADTPGAAKSTSGSTANPVSSSLSALTREFTVVPAGDALYSHLEVVRQAGWSTLPAETAPATMTRYEMALEVAKVLIAVRAHQHADTQWPATVAPQDFQALRALCAGLQAELARFNVDARATMVLIDSWLKTPASGSAPVTASFAFPDSDTQSVSRADANRFNLTDGARGNETTLNLPLSQRLRVYGAVSSLARSQHDPLSPVEPDSAASTLRLRRASQSSFGSAGAAFSVTDWLQLRGSAARRPAANTLREALTGEAAASSSAASSGAALAAEERSFGADVDIALTPGVVLSGGVAHLNTSGGLLAGLSHFSGTKYEGSVGLSGWQNRVALSANLSRLVPEDSYALSMTAAQLNLGIGVTQQISLKLLYQQLFETPQQPRGEHMIAGGININF